MENGLIGEVNVPNYELLWKDTVRERDEAIKEYYALKRELNEANRLNSELLRKIMNSQKPKKGIIPDWMKGKFKIPLS